MSIRSRSSSIRYARRRIYVRVVVASLCVGLLLFSFSSQAFNTSPTPAKSNNVIEDFSRFSHSTDQHSRLACAACHQRVDNATTPRLPGHKACTNCHLAQFVSPAVPICSICHSSLSGNNPPVHAFPSKFKESFNVKFDHAQHNRGDARPSTGCTSCHSASLRRGVAMTIPAGINAHSNCYQCHTPGKTSSGRDIGSCATCHSVATYRRTPTTAVAFNVSFSHADHGPRKRLNCADCHSIKEGLPQTRQVSSPRAAQHFPTGRGQSCATCHNNKRAFGEKNFDDCTRCHKGATFKFRAAG